MSDESYKPAEFSSNPYSPTAQTEVHVGGPIVLDPEQQRGFVGHIKVLGILMIIQGVLDVFAALIVGVYAWFMPQFFMDMQEEMAKQAIKNGGQAPNMPPEMGMFVAIFGGLLASAMLLIGALTIYSGVGVMDFRRRNLAITSLFLGMLTIVTCYCFPTSLGLGIYGLIVLFSQSTKLACYLRGQGHSANSIELAFLSQSGRHSYQTNQSP